MIVVHALKLNCSHPGTYSIDFSFEKIREVVIPEISITNSKLPIEYSGEGFECMATEVGNILKIIVLNSDEEEIAIGELRLFEYFYKTKFQDGFKPITVYSKLLDNNKMDFGILEIQIEYFLSITMCEKVVSMQITELLYDTRKPKLELKSANENINFIITAFPEIHFDEFDSCFYLIDDFYLPEITSHMDDTKNPELHSRKRACDNCCIIF